jgi:hypothetical protein
MENLLEILELAKEKLYKLDAIYLSMLIANCSDLVEDWIEEGLVDKKHQEELDDIWENKYKKIYGSNYEGCFPNYNGDGISENDFDYGSIWLLYMNEKVPENGSEICDEIDSDIRMCKSYVFRYKLLINHIRVKILVLEHYVDCKTDHDRSYLEIKNVLFTLEDRLDEFRKWKDYVIERYAKLELDDTI